MLVKLVKNDEFMGISLGALNFVDTFSPSRYTVNEMFVLRCYFPLPLSSLPAELVAVCTDIRLISTSLLLSKKLHRIYFRLIEL